MTIASHFRIKTYVGENYSLGTILAFATVALIFMPVYVTAIPGLALVAWGLCNSQCRRKIFATPDIKILIVFSSILIGIPLIYRNYLGVLTGLGIVALILFFLTFSIIMSPPQYERSLSLICISSVFGAAVAAVQVFAHLGDAKFRASSVTVNTNFYATMAALAALICIYKLTAGTPHKIAYFCIFLSNMAGLLMSDSRSAILAIFGGAVVYFFFGHKTKLLTASLIAVGMLTLVFIFRPDLLGRFANVARDSVMRINLWKAGFNNFLKSPFFGNGCFSMIHNQSTSGTGLHLHSHNIFVEMLQNFGIIGFVLVMLYTARHIINIYKFEKNSHFALIMGVLGYIFIHGMLDCTIIWPGAAAIILIIMSRGRPDEAHN